MNTCTAQTTSAPRVDQLHQVREMAHSDPAFALALAATKTPQQAAQLAEEHGLCVSADTLWRNRGRLLPGGLPSWRG